MVESEWKPAGERLTAAFADHSRYKEQLVDQVVMQSMGNSQRGAWVVLLVTVFCIAMLAGIGHFTPPRKTQGSESLVLSSRCWKESTWGLPAVTPMDLASVSSE